MTGTSIDHEHNADRSSLPAGDKYTVVARRYRPKTFDELVGQDTVAQALLRAIETHRVGHAYLFTGARGVGKTSTARIFAKALNASSDGTGRFDPSSEIALAIDSGEDMDVIEIDGASNRGIDEIRQLRSNASIRPTRSAYKIYIIDEVHMLTTQAFNALLKTLEEPPGHVKFIFCTTDPEKIPITVLSRCQRFDFPPVHSDQILGRLKLICETEGTQADEDALRLIARRAAGSMRDSQSLLEQLLSFGGHRITVADVHAMLGTADEARLAAFAQCMIDRNAGEALVELDSAVSAGVDPGQLAEQLLGYLRDMMAVSIGGPTELIRTANPNSADALKASGISWGTMTLLSAMQLLDETIVRMKHSVQSRILLEIALVQICNLVDLQALADVIKGLSQGTPKVAPTPARAPGSGPIGSRSASSSTLSQASVATPSTPQVVPAAVDDSKKKDQLAEATAQNGGPSLTDPTSPSVVLPSSQPSSAEVGQRVPLQSAHWSAPGTCAPTSVTSDRPSAAAQSRSEPPFEANPSSGQPTGTMISQVQADAHSSAGSATDESVAGVVTTVAPGVDGGQGGDRPIDLLREAAATLGGLVQQAGAMALEVIETDPHHWRVLLAREASYALPNFQSTHNMARILQAIHARCGRRVEIEYVLTQQALPADSNGSVPSEVAALEARPSVPQTQRIREAMAIPVIKKFLEVFDGHVLRVDERPAVVHRIPAPHGDAETAETTASSSAVDDASTPT
jgi:DNA polymerase III subunit gamma/tau